MMKRHKKNHTTQKKDVHTPPAGGKESSGDMTGIEQPVAEEVPDGVQPETPPEEMETVPRAEYDALNERYLRVIAEYDNFRKRTNRERSDLLRTATEQLMLKILPILDNLDRATEHRTNSTNLEEYVNGIAIIEDQLRAVLAGAGLEKIEVIGVPFNPEIHDAIMQIESDDYESGLVAGEAEKGYSLTGKVIRHPKVIVSK